MRTAVLAIALAALVMLAGASARAEGEVFLVQYVDVTPAGAAATTTALREARTAGLNEPGNMSFEAFVESARPSRFAIVSLWRDQKAVEAYQASGSAKALRDKIEPVRVTAFDDRTLHLLAGDPIGGRGASVPMTNAIHVLTHVDAIPPFKDDATGAIKALGGASVKDPGVARYQVLVQTNRQNHFKLIETWADQKAFDAHVAAPHTRQFRDYMQKGAGSPYDERLFKALP